jgi:hypothetical protein
LSERGREQRGLPVRRIIDDGHARDTRPLVCWHWHRFGAFFARLDKFFDLSLSGS